MKKNEKREKNVWFSPFPRIFRFLLHCRTNVLGIVSQSVFDTENDDEVRFTLCLAIVEILRIQLLSKLSKWLAMPSSIAIQHRVKRTSPSFSASKTEGETITKTSVLQSSKVGKSWETEETIHLSPFFIFFSIFRRSRQFGGKYPEYQFFMGF